MPDIAQYLTKKDLGLAEGFSSFLGLFFGLNGFHIWVIAKVSPKGGEDSNPRLHQLSLFENSTLSSPSLERATEAVGEATATTEIVFCC